MIFKTVELENYGLFQNAIFDLAPRNEGGQRKNIVLFGGKNGAGKTTLLEAVRLCLYGQRSRGTRVRRRDYEAFLKGRIHRPRAHANSLSEAAVALEFEHVHAGEKTTYRVERRWRDTGKAVEEDFSVSSPSRTQQTIAFDQAHWEEFIQELIPPGVSQLFFFDGEKIQALAEEEGRGSELARSIKSLLGLDLAERLDADLTTYLRRQDEIRSGGSTDARLNEIKSNLESSHVRRTRLKQDQAQMNSRILSLESQVDAVEARISEEGGSYARHREQLVAMRGASEEALKQIRAEVRELCDDLLPFALIPDLCDQLLRSLETDEEVRRQRAIRKVVEDRLGDLRERIGQLLGKRGGDACLADDIGREIQAAFLPDEAAAREEPLHPISAATLGRLREGVRRAHVVTAPRARQLLRELETTSRGLSRVEAALRKVPEDDVLQPLLEELRSLHRRLGEMRSEADEQKERIAAAESDWEQLKKERRREEARRAEASGLGERLRLVASVQSAIDAFAERVKVQKVTELGRHFKRCFDALARKEDMVREVAIDPDSFRVTFLDQVGRPLAKSELSAGEKQIYAIAMLWALALTSQRPLPFLIDTPLGRLDSEHRSKLVRQYFPHVAHQVVILSTDTEIDRSYFDELEPFIARAYHLEYDGRTNCTRVDPGYFWSEESDEHHEVESPAA